MKGLYLGDFSRNMSFLIYNEIQSYHKENKDTLCFLLQFRRQTKVCLQPSTALSDYVWSYFTFKNYLCVFIPKLTRPHLNKINTSCL